MLNRIDIKYFKMAVGSGNIGAETDSDIVARCPVCGDSRKSKTRKRLHLYEKNNVTLTNCFNGDCTINNKPMYLFLRDHFPGLIEQYKRETFQFKIENLSNDDVFSQFKSDNGCIDNNITDQNSVVEHDLTQYFQSIDEREDGLNYLRSRNIFYNWNKYGKWYFGYQDLKIQDKIFKITDSIIIPLYSGNKMYGFYSRNIKNKFFSTYMPEQNVGYKIWNWFNIDKSKPVYIFEGIFDCISSGLENSVALMGAKIPDQRLNELTEPVFILDNDKTGLKNALQYAKKYKVYIQPRNLPEKDMNQLLKNNPFLNIENLIKNNLYTGIVAEIEIKSRL